jgi:hypothetical protein
MKWRSVAPSVSAKTNGLDEASLRRGIANLQVLAPWRNAMHSETGCLHSTKVTNTVTVRWSNTSIAFSNRLGISLCNAVKLRKVKKKLNVFAFIHLCQIRSYFTNYFRDFFNFCLRAQWRLWLMQIPILFHYWKCFANTLNKCFPDVFGMCMSNVERQSALASSSRGVFARRESEKRETDSVRGNGGQTHTRGGMNALSG